MGSDPSVDQPTNWKKQLLRINIAKLSCRSLFGFLTPVCQKIGYPKLDDSICQSFFSIFFPVQMGSWAILRHSHF